MFLDLVLVLVEGMESFRIQHLGIQIEVDRMVEFVFVDGTKLPKIQQNSVNKMFRIDLLTLTGTDSIGTTGEASPFSLIVKYAFGT